MTSSAATSSAASTPASSAASSASGVTYSELLIPASAVPLSGVTRGTPVALTQGKGVAASYTAPGNRVIGDSIVVLGSSSLAKTAYASAVTAAKAEVTSPQVSAVPVGGGGTAIRGTASTGEVAVLLFTEGRALVVLQFNSSAGDPVPTALVQQVTLAQDSKIKSGLPG